MLDLTEVRLKVDEILAWRPTEFPSSTEPEPPRVPSLFKLAATVLSKFFEKPNIDNVRDQNPHDAVESPPELESGLKMNGSERQQLRQMKENQTEPEPIPKNAMPNNRGHNSGSKRKVNYRQHSEDEDSQRNPDERGSSSKKLKK
ncbi:hypothetical protein KR074_009035 [Drosophila pseudoananassae]|nr:hypothetical protein KR074_009035 [Drosophila pseudoananassae]